MFEVLFAYYGWQYSNYVLNEVRDPVRTLKIAGPLGLGITATLYIFANIAYFAYVPPHSPQKHMAPEYKCYSHSASSKAAILESGTTVASLFFENVFGVQAQRALTVFIALRCVLYVLLKGLGLILRCVTAHWGECLLCFNSLYPFYCLHLANVDRVSI
jgi:amino acid transporter